LVWTDDDTRVDVGWLSAYERAIDQHPEAAVFGGPIRPQFEGKPARWLTDVWADISPAYAARELGDVPFAFTGDHDLPYGANFVVRAREQKMFPYDPNLGRVGSAGSVGEETAVIRAILGSGGTGWWVPGASVDHWVPRKRQSVGYLRQYFALQGRTFHRGDGRDRSKFRERLFARVRMVQAELLYRAGRLTGNPKRWIGPLIQASTLRGSISK
jgi:hypothetical protein